MTTPPPSNSGTPACNSGKPACNSGTPDSSGTPADSGSTTTEVATEILGGKQSTTAPLEKPRSIIHIQMPPPASPINSTDNTIESLPPEIIWSIVETAFKKSLFEGLELLQSLSTTNKNFYNICKCILKNKLDNLKKQTGSLEINFH